MPNQASNPLDREERSAAPGSSPESQEKANPVPEPGRGQPEKWKLKIQGVTLEFDEPAILVRDALLAAGFDPGKSWHIFLIVQGRQKEELSVDAQVDLRTPGIEKIRLMQRNVDNGDSQGVVTRRAFQLLDSDHEYLDRLGLRWETMLIE